MPGGGRANDEERGRGLGFLAQMDVSSAWGERVR
jgi:hypothetical protein